MSRKATLGEVGEKKIISDIIIPTFKNDERTHLAPIGDDCAVLDWNKSNLVWTIDVAPKPVSWLFKENDYYTLGWYLVAINLSDLASMGANPQSLLVSIEAPPTLYVSDFKKLLNGIKDCSREFNFDIVGGNLKESNQLVCTGSAIGSIDIGFKPLTRKGCNVGDVVLCIGNLGTFWASVLSQMNKIKYPSEYETIFYKSLYRPRPKVVEGILLQKSGLVSACMDASDGIFTSLFEIAHANNVSIEVTYQEEEVDQAFIDIYKKSNVNPLSTALSWGDWQLVCTTKDSNFDRLSKLLEKENIFFKRLGIIQEKKIPEVYARQKKILQPNKELINERFSDTSYMITGVSSWIEKLKKRAFI